MFQNLATNRLELRIINNSDRDFIFEEFQNDFINNYLFDAEPMTDISQADELIEFYNAIEPRNQNRWVLIEKSTNTKLGTCGFHLWNPDKKEVEIGFELLQQYNGKGYMLEALKAIIYFAKMEMMVTKIHAIVYLENNQCIQLLEKLNFIKVDQRLLNYRDQEYMHYVYALLL